MNKEQFDLLLQELRNINEHLEYMTRIEDSIKDLTDLIKKTNKK